MIVGFMPGASAPIGFMGLTEDQESLGAYPEFGTLVRQIVDGRSTRAIQIRTSVSHSTVADMLKGIRPKAATIRLFADGMGVDPIPLLEAAGYPLLPSDRERAKNNKNESSPEAPQITREPYFDELRPEGYNDDDDPIVRAIAEKEAREAYRRTYKSVADAIRDARRLSPGTIVGPAPRDDED